MRRISHGLVDMFYTDETDRFLAKTLIYGTTNQTDNITVSFSDPQTQNTQKLTDFAVDSDQKDRNVPLKITIRFKKEKSFTAKMGEDINEFLETYFNCCNNVSTTSEQKLIIFSYYYWRRGSPIILQ